jgi:hypothetical protein
MRSWEMRGKRRGGEKGEDGTEVVLGSWVA